MDVVQFLSLSLRVAYIIKYCSHALTIVPIADVKLGLICTMAARKAAAAIKSYLQFPCTVSISQRRDQI